MLISTYFALVRLLRVALPHCDAFPAGSFFVKVRLYRRAHGARLHGAAYKELQGGVAWSALWGRVRGLWGEHGRLWALSFISGRVHPAPAISQSAARRPGAPSATGKAKCCPLASPQSLKNNF